MCGVIVASASASAAVGPVTYVRSCEFLLTRDRDLEMGTYWLRSLLLAVQGPGQPVFLGKPTPQALTELGLAGVVGRKPGLRMDLDLVDIDKKIYRFILSGSKGVRISYELTAPTLRMWKRVANGVTEAGLSFPYERQTDLSVGSVVPGSPGRRSFLEVSRSQDMDVNVTIGLDVDCAQVRAFDPRAPVRHIVWPGAGEEEPLCRVEILRTLFPFAPLREPARG